MAILSAVENEPPLPGTPSWIEPSLHVTAGRDPLGLQTITLDRIMPLLLPGILVLSQRARYFSFHSFLLSEYQRLRLPLSNNDLSAFIKHREFEYAVAVQLCPRGCGAQSSGVVGKLRAGPAAQASGETIMRQESVESPLGGYGLYYRSPMIDLGLVVPRGSELGDIVTEVDVLHPAAPGRALAEAFGGAIADTSYFRQYMVGADPVPKQVLAELAEVACLCRLPDFPDEQAALRTALFEPAAPAYGPLTEERRRGFALLLRSLQRDPATAVSNGAFRQTVWDDFLSDPAGDGPTRQTIAKWAALAAKDWWQESFSSIWAHFLRLGIERPDGLSPHELDLLLREDLVRDEKVDVLGRELSLSPSTVTRATTADVARVTEDLLLEDLRRWAAETNTAAAGLVLLFSLYSRLPEHANDSPGWIEIGTQSSERQPSFLHFVQVLEDHLQDAPTLADTIAWLVRRFVIGAHEQIAYSKLPEFTFRFRWEGGRLRFYSLGLGRFDLADIRRQSMSRISEDVGLWEGADGQVRLTPPGVDFLEEVFGS